MTDLQLLHRDSFEVDQACAYVTRASDHLGLPHADVLALVAHRLGEKPATAEGQLRSAARYEAEPLTPIKACPLCGLHPFDFTVDEYAREVDRLQAIIDGLRASDDELGLVTQDGAAAVTVRSATQRVSDRHVALDLAKIAGTMSTLHDQLETALLNFADHMTDSYDTAAELRDEINALSNRIESWGRVLDARTEHLA